MVKKMKEGKMDNFLEISCITKEEKKKILEDIEKKIETKIKEGILTDREVREIEHMKLRPLPDILDVQSVYEKLKI
jgi:CRISPR/Cas system-associated endonuclease Cas1